jgi:hypothetical protein
LSHAVGWIIVMRNLALLILLASLLLGLYQAWIRLDGSLGLYWLDLLRRGCRMALSYVHMILRMRCTVT